MLSLATPANNQVLAAKRASDATKILTKVVYLNCSPWHFKIEPLWYLIHKQAELTGYSVTVWLETSSGTLRLASSSWQSGRNQKSSSRAFCLENSSDRRHRPVRCALQVLLRSLLRVFVNRVVSCKFFSCSLHREVRQVIKDSSLTIRSKSWLPHPPHRSAKVKVMNYRAQNRKPVLFLM